MKSFKCSVCGKTFDIISNARRHVGARSSCFRSNAVVQRTSVVIRASDRVVGGREHVEDYGVPSRRVPDANPAAEDEEAEEANIDIEPEHSGRFFDSYFRSSTDLKSISEIDCIFFTGTPSDSIRGLIALLRSAVSGADINQEFNAFAGQSPAPSIVPIPERRVPILNYSQRRILNMKKVYKLNLRATNAIMTLVQDPKFKSSELGTNRVQNLNRILLRGYGGDVSEYDFHTAVDGKQDLKMYT